MLKTLYGIKSIKSLDKQDILRLANKYNIPSIDCYILDPDYLNYLNSLDTINHKEHIKNHSQPLQALYYNKSGQMVSFHINCYAGGFPNLNWNPNKIMQAFPPQTQAPLDSILSVVNHFNFLRPISGAVKINNEKFDYLIFIYWNRFMGRQSKRLIQTIQKNSELSNPEKVRIIYINNDAIFLSSNKN